MANLLSGATAVSTGPTQNTAQNKQTTVVASVKGTGSVSATVVVEASNDAVDFFTLATITLSGSGTAVDGFGASVRYPYTRAKVTAISGTGAAVYASVRG